MKTLEHLLGRREGQKLKFKAADALKDLRGIGREVTAMLNAGKGGTVWIGMAEDQGVAVRLDPIADAEVQQGRLWDHLLDTIEPSPRDEVHVRVEDGLIAVEIVPSAGRAPYAQLNGVNRAYLIRVGDRIRTMTREEIFKPGRPTPNTPAMKLKEERERAKGRGANGVWVCIRPAKNLDVDVQDKEIAAMLCDPLLTGNRISGWNFAVDDKRPILSGDKIAQGRSREGGIEIHRTGEILFTVPMRDLHWKGDDCEIWPYCLLEYPTSVFRLASRLYKGAGDEIEVWADLAIFRVKGWKLRPYSPVAVGYAIREPHGFEDEDLILPNAPIRLSGGDIAESPDRCAHRLLVLVYEAFGYREDAMPHEFNAATGRLELER